MYIGITIRIFININNGNIIVISVALPAVVPVLAVSLFIRGTSTTTGGVPALEITRVLGLICTWTKLTQFAIAVCLFLEDTLVVVEI